MQALKVKVFVEGGPGRGMGHLVRCSALVAAFLEKGWTVDLLIDGPESVSNFYPGCKIEFGHWQSKSFERIYPPFDISVIDSYEASELTITEISNNSRLTLYFDDFGNSNYPPGIVVNSTLGVEFQTLRRSFWDISKRKTRNIAKNIMIMLGGDDIRSLMPHIYKLLNKNFPHLKCHFVCASFSRTVNQMKDLIIAPHSLHLDLMEDSLKTLMTQCDLAISASGQSSFEVARCGLPTVFLKVIENQEANVKILKDNDFGIDIINWDSPNLDRELINSLKKGANLAYRKKQAYNGQKLVDGQGARRLVRLAESKL